MTDINHIEFTGTFDCAICLNADLPARNFFRYLEGIPILAADGAGIRLLAEGLKADYVVGDLDSFFAYDSFREYDDDKIIHLPDQEMNDFEKTLLFAETKGYRKALILGMHGGELEHSLNNWSVFKRYAKRMELCIYDKTRFGILINKGVKLSSSPGEIISIIPQPEILLSTENLRWELKNECLRFGQREGARNKSIGSEISIKVHSGEAMLFFDSRMPYAPVIKG
ncbi:MAG: thiamine diphosphokinase [Candidatus Kapaibacterium sp.]